MAIAILLLLLLERGALAPEHVRPACHEKPQGEPGQAGGVTGTRTNVLLRGEATLGRISVQEVASQSTQLWPTPGRFPGWAGSQAAGRWSLLGPQPRW